MENTELTEADLLGLIKNLTTLNKNMSSWTPEKLFKEFKKHNQINDLAEVQKIFLKMGATEQQIQAISKAWKTRYTVTPKDVRSSYGTGRSTISDEQLLGLFKTAYEELGVQPANAKRNDSFNKHLDKFDDEIEVIANSAKQLGFTDGPKIKAMDWNKVRKDPGAIKQLAALGFAGLKYKPKKSGKNVDDFAKDFDDILEKASQFGLKNPKAFVKDARREQWTTLLRYPAALAGLASIGWVLLNW